MSVDGSGLWTIDELGAEAALALSVGYEGPPNDRVREVPDRRTIRYYASLGLVDRPAEMRGRTALYGRRHLMQLVAIKRLQARGLSLAEVQEKLLVLTDAALAAIARLPDRQAAAGRAQAATEEEPAPAPAPTPARRSSKFWAEAPAPAAGAGAETLTGVGLGPGATLLLAAARPLDEGDLEAIHAAAAPLLRLLESRRLIRRGGEGKGGES